MQNVRPDSSQWAGPHGNRRRRIHKELRNLGDTRRWWADACKFIEDDSLETGAHMAFHALRELNAMLLDLLAPIADPKAASRNAQEVALIEKLLGDAGFDDRVIDGAVRGLPPGAAARIDAVCRLLELDGATASRWKKWNPVGKAHRRGIGMRSIADQDVQRDFAEAEVVIGAVAERWAQHFPRWHALVDEIVRSEPSRVTVARLLESVPPLHGLMTRFFDRIDGGVDWFGHLSRAGLLIRVPEKEISDDETTARFLPWPAATYLRSVASSFPEEVAQVLGDVAGRDNPLALHSVVAIAADLPAPLAASLVGPIGDSVVRWRGVRRGPVVGDLVERLVTGGAVDDALRLARAVLALDAGRHVGGDHEQSYAGLLDEVLRAFGEERDALVDVLVNVLAAASDDGADRSVVWLRALDDSRPRREDARREAAIRLRDLARGRVDLLARLLRSGVPAAQRIALHLARDAKVDPTFVFDDITGLVGDELRIELGELVHDRWANLGDEARDAYLSMIERGPVLGTAGHDEEYARRWKGYYLQPILEHLDQGEDRVAVLIAAAEVPTFDVLRRGEVRAFVREHESPWSAHELAALDTADLGDMFETFEPNDGRDRATRRGLGEVLAEVVAADVDRYRGVADAAGAVAPELLHGVISGVAAAARRDAADWHAVVEAAATAVRWDGEPGGAWDDFRDPRVQLRLAALTALGSRLRHGGPPPEGVDEVLEIIGVALADPHPHGGEEWLELSPIGEPPHTVRNAAFETLVNLALGVGLDEDPNPAPGRLLLEALENETNPYVFAQVGYRARRIAARAPDWLRANVHAVFGPPGGDDPRHRVAWRAATFDEPPDGPLRDTLVPYYEAWVSKLDGGALDADGVEIGSQIGALAVAGDLAEDVVERFFEVGPLNMRTAALRTAAPAVDAEVDSAVALWERRRRAAIDRGELEELSAVTSWTRSDLLDPRWRLEQLAVATNLGVALGDPGGLVMDLAITCADVVEDAETLLDVLDRVLAAADIHELGWSTDHVAGILDYVEGARSDLEDRVARARASAAMRLQDDALLKARAAG